MKNMTVLASDIRIGATAAASGAVVFNDQHFRAIGRVGSIVVES